MTKKQARVTGEKVFSSPTDRVLNTLETISNTASCEVLGGGVSSVPRASPQGISTEVQPDRQKALSDFTRKLTFQIRDSIYQRLKERHYLLDKQLGIDAPDREVIVEEAIAALLDKMDNGEDLGEVIALRQRKRQQELEAGTLINPNSRKKR